MKKIICVTILKLEDGKLVEDFSYPFPDLMLETLPTSVQELETEVKKIPNSLKRRASLTKLWFIFDFRHKDSPFSIHFMDWKYDEEYFRQFKPENSRKGM